MDTKIRDGLTAVVSVDMDKVMRKRAQEFGLAGGSLKNLREMLQYRLDLPGAYRIKADQMSTLRALIVDITAYLESIT